MDELEKTTARLKSMGSVKAAILFGSRAKGRHRKDSDTDICVISDDDSPLSMSSEKMDLSLFHKLPLIVRYHVFRDGKLLFCKDDRLLTKLKYWTIKLYLDEKHWRDALTAKVLS